MKMTTKNLFTSAAKAGVRTLQITLSRCAHTGMALTLALGLATGIAQAQVQAWTPSNITCVAWYDAADTNTVKTSGSAVTNWLDKSGNGYHALQTVPASQPTITTWKGLPAIANGSDDFLTTAAADIIAGTNNYSVIAVMTSAFGQGADTFGAGWSIIVSPGDSAVVLTSAGAAAFSAGPAYGGGLVTTIMDQNSEKTIKRAIDGGAFTSAALNKTNLRSSSRGFMLGRGNNVSQAGYIGEVIVIKSAVSFSDQKKIEGYLAWKWDLVANLPAGHPFKIVPPLVDGKGGVVSYTDANGLNPTNTPYANGYVVHTFYASDTFSNSTALSVDVLVVAGGGGGGGGDAGGGGGAGGLLYYGHETPGNGHAEGTSYAVSAGAITVVVGGGGAGGTGSVHSGNGADSWFGTLQAYGGGGGGSGWSKSAALGSGSSGGSGGGRGHNNSGTATLGAGTSGQGFAGAPITVAYGGGGGAGAASTNDTGGAGLQYSISGGVVTYAAGGDGVWAGSGAPGTYARGNGGSSKVFGTANGIGGNGGSGIVIVRYAYVTPPKPTRISFF